MSARWWRRRIAPLKRDKKPPDEFFGAVAFRPEGAVAVTADGEIARGNDGSELADLLLCCDKFVWYADPGPSRDLLRDLTESGVTATLVFRGAILRPFASGKHTAAVVISYLHEGLPESVTIVNLRISSPAPYIEQPEEAACATLRRADKLRLATHAAFGTYLEMTPARTAFQAWRRHMKGGMGPRKVFYQPSRRATPDFRRAYFGGYNLCKPGNHRKVRMYDMQGAYAYAMRQGVPVGPATAVLEERPGEIGFYRVHGVLDPHRPVPFLIRDDEGRVQSPTKGKYIDIDGWITSQELELARELGAVLGVTQGWIFKGGIGTPFEGFIGKCEAWQTETERGTVENQYVKMVRNSLYGRFGRKAEMEEVMIGMEPPEDDGYGTRWMPHVAADGPTDEWAWARKVTDEKRPGNMAHWAAWLTATVRCRLIRTIVQLGQENVLYADTDSIVTTGEIETGIQYGDWRLVSSYSTFRAYASKRYVGTTADGVETVRAAGIPAGDPAEIARHMQEFYGLSP